MATKEERIAKLQDKIDTHKKNIKTLEDAINKIKNPGKNTVVNRSITTLANQDISEEEMIRAFRAAKAAKVAGDAKTDKTAKTAKAAKTPKKASAVAVQQTDTGYEDTTAYDDKTEEGCPIVKTAHDDADSSTPA